MNRFQKFAPVCSRLCTALLFGTFALTSAQAQDPAYPNKPVRIIVPFTAGSATDIIARAVGEGLRKELGNQPVIVENKPGAGGTLGAAQVASSAADGYTLLVHSAGHVANAALYPGLRYDPIKDFKPLAMLASVPNVLVVSPKSNYKDLAALVAKAKAEPGKLLYASAGNGSATHMNAEKFRRAGNMVGVANKVFASVQPAGGCVDKVVATGTGLRQWSSTSALNLAQYGHSGASNTISWRVRDSVAGSGGGTACAVAASSALASALALVWGAGCCVQALAPRHRTSGIQRNDINRTAAGILQV